MLDKKILQGLEKETEMYITTFDGTGRPGTVPVWFIYRDGKVLVTTSETSKKVQKIKKNNRVVATLENKEGPLRFEGRAEITRDKARVKGVVQLLETKYRWRYPEDPERVLLEITPWE